MRCGGHWRSIQPTRRRIARTARVLWTPLKGYKNRQALMALRESLRRSPGYHPALVWQCLIFLHVGMIEEAIDGLQTALATQPDDGFALTFLGQARMLQGDYDEAAS